MTFMLRADLQSHDCYAETTADTPRHDHHARGVVTDLTDLLIYLSRVRVCTSWGSFRLTRHIRHSPLISDFAGWAIANQRG